MFAGELSQHERLRRHDLIELKPIESKILAPFGILIKLTYQQIPFEDRSNSSTCQQPHFIVAQLLASTNLSDSQKINSHVTVELRIHSSYSKTLTN